MQKYCQKHKCLPEYELAKFVPHEKVEVLIRSNAVQKTDSFRLFVTTAVVLLKFDTATFLHRTNVRKKERDRVKGFHHWTTHAGRMCAELDSAIHFVELLLYKFNSEWKTSASFLLVLRASAQKVEWWWKTFAPTEIFFYLWKEQLQKSLTTFDCDKWPITASTKRCAVAAAVLRPCDVNWQVWYSEPKKGMILWQVVIKWYQL